MHPKAVRAARRHGLSFDPTGTAHVRDVITGDDLVIAVCDNAHEGLAETSRPRPHWSVPDPAPVDTDASFEAAFTDIAGRIDRLAAAIHHRGAHHD